VVALFFCEYFWVTMSNIDPSEVSKFDAIASRWWAPEGEFKPLHDLNPLRLKFITDRVDLAGKKILDVGCGGGILTESLAQAGAIVTGIDVSKNALDVARAHNIGINNQDIDYIEYKEITVETLAEQQPHSFDVITCLEMLEHVPDPSSVVRACSQLVKTGGYVFFSTINRTAKAYLFAIIGAEYVLKLLPKGVHDYAKFIRPAELDTWARASGLQLQEFAGISYNPLTKQYALITSVDVNYLAMYKV
jgi:2-polyprenyl-6-hydroxyphenyl methylase / 3-demethylubiquinone-9 3-methyltransferase